MNNLDQIENPYSKLLNWKRVSILVITLTLVSYFTAQLPTIYFNHSVRKVVQQAATQCPMELAVGFQLDSINIIDSKEIWLYITDELGQFPINDTSKLKDFFAERAQKFKSNQEFQTFVKHGYIIGIDMKDQFQNRVCTMKLNPASF